MRWAAFIFGSWCMSAGRRRAVPTTRGDYIQRAFLQKVRADQMESPGPDPTGNTLYYRRFRVLSIPTEGEIPSRLERGIPAERSGAYEQSSFVHYGEALVFFTESQLAFMLADVERGILAARPPHEHNQ
jgi:hypothetical protein